MKIAMCLEYELNNKWHLARQIGVRHAVSLKGQNNDIAAWDLPELARAKARYNDFGYELSVMEGWLPIKGTRLGSEEGKLETARVLAMVENMGALGIGVYCYSWMANYSWMRTSVRTAHQKEESMDNLSHGRIIGIDVSRDWLDVHCLPDGHRCKVPNAPAGHAAVADLARD